MKMLSQCCGFAALFFVAALLPAEQPKQPAADKYQILLERVKQGDPTVDFLELRRAYSESPSFMDTGNSDDSKKMYEAFNHKDYASALKYARKILDINYCDIDAQHTAYLAYRELNDAEHADFHHTVSHNLIQSILRTGDGKSPETAMEVITVREEYVILMVMGLQPNQQSLESSGGHQYDRMEATNPETHEKVTIFFNIDRTMARWMKLFSK